MRWTDKRLLKHLLNFCTEHDITVTFRYYADTCGGEAVPPKRWINLNPLPYNAVGWYGDKEPQWATLAHEIGHVMLAHRLRSWRDCLYHRNKLIADEWAASEYGETLLPNEYRKRQYRRWSLLALETYQHD